MLLAWLTDQLAFSLLLSGVVERPWGRPELRSGIFQDVELVRHHEHTVIRHPFVPREMCMHGKTARSILCLLAVSALFAAPGLAQQSSNHVQINHDIFVEPGQKSGDLVCVNCSIFVRGEVAGDVVTVHGNVVIEQGAQVAGDVTTVLGNVRIQSAGQVRGDAVAVGGAVRSEPQATIGGNVTSLSGAGWILLVVLLPMAFMGGLIALIVWLIARMRHPHRS